MVSGGCGDGGDLPGLRLRLSRRGSPDRGDANPPALSRLSIGLVTMDQPRARGDEPCRHRRRFHGGGGLAARLDPDRYAGAMAGLAARAERFSQLPARTGVTLRPAADNYATGLP